MYPDHLAYLNVWASLLGYLFSTKLDLCILVSYDSFL